VIRVVVADDHAIFRQGLVELLSSEAGVVVEGTASNGAEALALASSITPDVLILDISMPVLDGFEVVRHVRKQRLPVRIVMLSMHNDAVSARRAFELGADGFVPKEGAFDEVLEAVTAVAAGRRFCSPPVEAALAECAGGRPGQALSSRETQVAALIAGGRTTKEIAARLGISAKTVETHRQRIMDKLGCHKAAQIALYVVKAGILK
jgi:DNA-binding NarL/FixJ family response regulator